MERRVLIAIFLSFIVLYLYQAMVVKPVPKPVEGSLPTSSAPAVAGATGAASGVATSPPGTATPPAPQAPSAAPLTGDAAEHDVRIETRDVVAVFTNRGARLKSWRLKHFFNAERQPLELVATSLASTHPLPF